MTQQHAIRTRILLAFIGIIFTMVLMSGFLLVVHHQIINSYNKTLDTIIIEYNITELSDNLIQQFNDRLQNPEDQDNIQAYNKSLSALQDIFIQLDTFSMNTECAIAYRGLKNAIQHIASRCTQGMEHFLQGDITETEAIYNELTRKQSYVIDTATRLIMLELKYANEQQARLKRIHFVQFSLLLVSILLVAFGCLYYAIVFTTKLTKPLEELSTLLTQVANKNLDIHVDETLLNRRDEIGHLSQAFNAMLNNLKQTISDLNTEIKIRKDAELNAEQASKAKSRFLANMNHELRTPMNAIIGFASFLEEAKLTKEERQHMQGIQRSSEALLAIINNILDISKIEAGKMILEKRSFNIREQIDNAITVVQHKTIEKGLSLEYSIDENLPEYLQGDAIRIFQILMNLLNNAVKFTE